MQEAEDSNFAVFGQFGPWSHDLRADNPGYKGMTRLVNEVNPPNLRRLTYFREIAQLAESIFRVEFDEFLNGLAPEEPEAVRSSLAVGFILGGYDSNETSQFRVLHWSSHHF